MDSLLINLNDKMDTVFNVYRLSDFSFLGSCGVRGEGPDDISFGNYIPIYTIVIIFMVK